MIDFHCAHCDVVLSAKDSRGGRKIRCPSCRGEQIVPPRIPDPAEFPREEFQLVSEQPVPPGEQPFSVTVVPAPAAGKPPRRWERHWSEIRRGWGELPAEVRLFLVLILTGLLAFSGIETLGSGPVLRWVFWLLAVGVKLLFLGLLIRIVFKHRQELFVNPARYVENWLLFFSGCAALLAIAMLFEIQTVWETASVWPTRLICAAIVMFFLWYCAWVAVRRGRGSLWMLFWPAYVLVALAMCWAHSEQTLTRRSWEDVDGNEVAEYVDTYTANNKIAHRKLSIRRLDKLVYSARGPMSATGKPHGMWQVMRWGDNSRDWDKPVFYWYGDEITEGEWHLRQLRK